MENFNQNQTKTSWWDNLTPKGRNTLKVLGVIAIIVIAYLAVAFFAPGMNFLKSTTGNDLEIDGTVIDNASKADKIDLPGNSLSTKVKSKTKYNLLEYTWNGNSTMIVANGGPQTSENSLMEKYGVNLNIGRQDDFSLLQAAMVNFTAEFDSGNLNPQSNTSAFGVSIMGDGAPYFISTLNKMLDDKFGEDKYHAVVKACYGASYGEDKLIGDKKYIDNPANLKGAVIVTAVGDGDWVVALNYIFANKGIKVNPNIGTYDPEAVNFIHNPNIIECANDYIASQLNGKVYDMKELKDGKPTGKTVSRKIDLCSTWLPGDKMIFDKVPHAVTISSTKDFPNQMTTTLIVLKEWSDANPDVVVNILKATYTAANQMKLYDDWRVKASQCVAKTYGYQSPQYWYEMFKGKTLSNGQIAGGTRIMNHADALQYYGLGDDGINRYKSVYEQVANYLTDLNPNGFSDAVKKVTPYDKAVDLTSLQAISGINSGEVKQVDYSKKLTSVMASGSWQINFNSGSSEILHSSDKQLKELYNLIVQAEGTKIIIEGHTDNTGNPDQNQILSKSRANAVLEYLQNQGLPFQAVESVEGLGDKKPIGNNNTAEGRYKNRRVQVTLLK